MTNKIYPEIEVTFEDVALSKKLVLESVLRIKENDTGKYYLLENKSEFIFGLPDPDIVQRVADVVNHFHKNIYLQLFVGDSVPNLKNLANQEGFGIMIKDSNQESEQDRLMLKLEKGEL